jgi:hypothetical protein
LAAVAEQQGEIPVFDQTQIAVEGLGGIEEARRNAGAVERAAEFLGDVGGLADAGEDQPLAADRGLLDGGRHLHE